jgi:integrase
MAGHVQDRWYKTMEGPGGVPLRVPTERHGSGLRYRARYVAPDGRERNHSFPDKQKRRAEAWLAQVEADMTRGQYVDPGAGKVLFERYATEWLASQTSDVSTRAAMEVRLRVHVFPIIGGRPLVSFLPTDIRQWAYGLQEAGLAASYRRVLFANVSAVFSAAVDDGLIGKNPCRAGSVKAPRLDPHKVVPWTREQVMVVRAALPERYRAMVDVAAGCGLRQGEVFGLAVEDIDLAAGTLHVVRQVKLLRGKPFLGLPKGAKLRDVPLPGSVARALAAHIERIPPEPIRLPWRDPAAGLVIANLVFSSREHKAMNRNYFNHFIWRRALVEAGMIAPGADPGTAATTGTDGPCASHDDSARGHGMHALRHFYASVLLDAGESVKALSEYLGHADPGFTLRTYTHLMPASAARSRSAIDHVFSIEETQRDGPTTARRAS